MERTFLNKRPVLPGKPFLQRVFVDVVDAAGHVGFGIEEDLVASVGPDGVIRGDQVQSAKGKQGWQREMVPDRFGAVAVGARDDVGVVRAGRWETSGRTP